MTQQAELPSIRNETTRLLAQSQKQYTTLATSDNTRRAYQSAIRQFETAGGKLPATEQMIANYITQQAKRLNPRTLSLHLTALSHWHRYQELQDPTQAPLVRKLLTGIYRTHGKPKQQAKALQPEHIQKMVAYCLQQSQNNHNLKSWRNNALIQVAYFGAFRRSELVAIQYEHLQFEPQGLLILVPRSKTDQIGQGKVKALPYANQTSSHPEICPVTAMKKWLNQAKITQGPVFRAINRWGTLQPKALHLDSINSIIKTIAQQCGFDFIAELSSHSLRRGFATSAAFAGAEFDGIKRQGGWKNDTTVRTYIEEGQLFDKNAAAQLLKASFAN